MGLVAGLLDDGVIDHAAEAEPRYGRADTRSRGAGRRELRNVGHDDEGVGARIQPRHSGRQASFVRVARPGLRFVGPDVCHGRWVFLGHTADGRFDRRRLFNRDRFGGLLGGLWCAVPGGVYSGFRSVKTVHRRWQRFWRTNAERLPARSGSRRRIGFEGGQMPLHRRLPKFGFVNIFKKDVQTVNVSELARCGEAEITADVLKKAGLIRNTHTLVKILGDGTIDKAFTVRAAAFSKSAIKKIEDAGGKAQVI